MKKHDSSCSEFVTLLEMEPVEEELISKKIVHVFAAWGFFGLKPLSGDHPLCGGSRGDFWFSWKFPFKF